MHAHESARTHTTHTCAHAHPRMHGWTSLVTVGQEQTDKNPAQAGAQKGGAGTGLQSPECSCALAAACNFRKRGRRCRDGLKAVPAAQGRQEAGPVPYAPASARPGPQRGGFSPPSPCVPPPSRRRRGAENRAPDVKDWGFKTQKVRSRQDLWGDFGW